MVQINSLGSGGAYFGASGSSQEGGYKEVVSAIRTELDSAESVYERNGDLLGLPGQTKEFKVKLEDLIRRLSVLIQDILPSTADSTVLSNLNDANNKMQQAVGALDTGHTNGAERLVGEAVKCMDQAMTRM